MPPDLADQIEELGWIVQVDQEEDVLRLIHVDTEHTVVLDADGDLTVPGDGDIGGTLRELQTVLTSALERYGGEEPTGPCDIDCEEAVSISSDTRIALDAPTIELSADADLALEGTHIAAHADGNFDADASGVLSLQGSLLELN